MKIWFHGTNETAAKAILAEGFREHCWFAAHLEDALAFGGPHVFEVALDVSEKNWQISIPHVVPREQIVGHTVFTKNVRFDDVELRKKIFEANQDGGVDGFAGKVEEHRWKEPVLTNAQKHRQEILDETEKIYNKWKDHDILKDVDPKRAKEMVLILDNEERFAQDVHRRFHKIALDLTKKVFEKFVGFDLVSVQPMRGPTDSVFYPAFRYSNLDDIHLELIEEKVVAKTKKMKSMLKFGDDGEYKVDINQLADEIRDDISREIMLDIRNNVGTIAKKKTKVADMSYEDIYINIVEISGILYRKTLRHGNNWIVVGPDIMKKFPEYLKLETPKNVARVCVLNSSRIVIVDPLFPKNEILCGYRGEDGLIDGYIYSPYIFLGPTPVVLDPEIFNPRAGLLTRYSKKLTKEGAKAYARIVYEE